MEIFEIWVSFPGCRKQRRTVVIGSGTPPPGCDYLLSEEQFAELVVGERIGVTGVVYRGIPKRRVPFFIVPLIPRSLPIRILWLMFLMYVFLKVINP